MFGIIADLLTTITAILFPVFASYKALTTSNPAQLIPWLQYFVVLTLLHLFESSLPFLFYIPFYSWLRFFLHLYLVAPGIQGASLIYTDYVHPFLRQHEKDIDDFISDSHEKAKKAGLQYAKQLIEWVRVNALGYAPHPPTPTPAAAAPYASYAQNLLARFSLPNAASAAAPAAGEWFGVLGNALQTLQGAASGKSREAQVDDLAASGTLIPGTLRSEEERASYINTQRDSLRVLLSAFDREASNLGSASSSVPSHAALSTGLETHPQSPSNLSGRGSSDTNLSKSRSELDFDKIEFEGEAPQGKASSPGAAGWMPWGWGSNKWEDEPGKKDQ